MKNVLITGAKGNIGSALVENLKNYHLTLANMPEIDCRDYRILEKAARGQDVLVHLAWNAKTENFQTKTSDPDNILMAKNAYEVALKTGVKRVIMASSVHADAFENFLSPILLSPYRKPKPITPYGKSKVIIEEMGKKYAEKGLEVICVRFGAVDSRGEGDTSGAPLWLSQRDLLSLMKKLIDAQKVPNNFVIVYGISNNKTRVHDYSNPFGWKPKDDSSKV